MDRLLLLFFIVFFSSLLIESYLSNQREMERMKLAKEIIVMGGDVRMFICISDNTTEIDYTKCIENKK